MKMDKSMSKILTKLQYYVPISKKISENFVLKIIKKLDIR